MKLKLLTLGALACFSAGIAHADGFYVGGTVGALSATSDTELHSGPLTIDGINLPVAIRQDISVTTGNTGFTGRLFGGYLFHIVNKFCLGVEANGEFNTANIESTPTISAQPVVGPISIFNTKLNVKTSYGLSLLPTYQVSDDFSVFARAGIAYGTINSTVSDVLANGDDTFHELGGQFGVGMEYALSKHLSIRGEYIYTAYRSVEQNFNPGITIPDSFGVHLPENYVNHVRTSAFGLGLTYRI